MSIRLSGSVLITDDGTQISETEFKYLDSQTTGSAKADAAVILGANKEISGLGDVSGAALSGSGNLNIGGAVRLDGAADTAAAVGADSFYFMDADDNLVKKESMADYATAIAGSGLAASSGVLSVDLNEVDAAAVDVANDSLLIIDADDSDATKKESFADLMTAAAGDGLGATAGVLAVNVDDSSIETDSDTMRVKALGITNAMLAGSIANAKLVNDSVSFGGVELALGASDATPAFDLSDASAYPGDSSLVTVGTVTSGEWQGTAIARAYIANDAINGDKIDNDAVDSEHIALGALDSEHYSSGSVQNDHLANSSLTVTAGDGLKTGGSVALGASVTLDIEPADFAGAGLEDDGSDNLRIKEAGVTNAMLSGSIANAKLVNDSVSFGGVEVALGAADATPAFDLSDATSLPVSTGLTAGTFNAGTYSFNGSTISDLGTVTTADINGGSMDNVVIGAATAAAASVTTLDASALASLDGGINTNDAFTVSTAGFVVAAGAISSSVGMAADGTSTMAGSGGFLHIGNGYAGTGMSLSAAGAINMKGALQVDSNAAFDGNVDLGDSSADLVTVAGRLTSSAGMHISAKSGPYALSIADGQGSAIASEWVTHSDRGLKTNIQEMDNGAALDAVMKLQPSTYEKISTGKSEIGFIAQEVAQVVPEICALDANGEGRGIDYSRMSTLLAGALKAQQEQIAQLKEIVAKLQK